MKSKQSLKNNAWQEIRSSSKWNCYVHLAQDRSGGTFEPDVGTLFAAHNLLGMPTHTGLKNRREGEAACTHDRDSYFPPTPLICIAI